MKKLFIILLIVFSCGDDNSLDKETSVGKKLISIKVERIDVDWGTVTKFYYKDGLVSKSEFSQNGTSSYDETTEFNYKENILVSLTHIDRGGFTSETKYTYVDGLISSRYSDYYKNYQNAYYTYNSKKQLVKWEATSISSKVGYNFEYNNKGNISKISTIVYASGYNSVSNIYDSYDNNKNPYSLIYSEALMKVNFLSKNNIIHIKNSIESDYDVSTFEYVYNDSGYPLEKIEIVDGKPKFKTTYTYE